MKIFSEEKVTWVWILSLSRKEKIITTKETLQNEFIQVTISDKSSNHLKSLTKLKLSSARPCFLKGNDTKSHFLLAQLPPGGHMLRIAGSHCEVAKKCEG